MKVFVTGCTGFVGNHVLIELLEKDGEVSDFEVRLILKNGQEKDISISAKMFPAKGYIEGAIIDITDRKKAEESLREREESYRTLSENLPGMVYRLFLREDNRMEFFNDMSETMTGYQVEELIYGEVCNLDNLILPEDKPLIIQTVKDAILKGKAFEVEYPWAGVSRTGGGV